jgi:ribosomal protein L37E
MFCTKCGAQSTSNVQQFCASCGAPFGNSPSTSQQNWVTPAPTQNWGTPAPQQNWAMPGQPYQAQGQYLSVPKTNTFALVGFILSLTYCFSFIGLALSIVGLVQINKDPVNQKGKGLAVAGIILGALGIIAGAFFGFVGALFSEDFYY